VDEKISGEARGDTSWELDISRAHRVRIAMVPWLSSDRLPGGCNMKMSLRIAATVH